VLGLLSLLRSPHPDAPGGRSQIVLGVAGETLVSMLLAPILMLFYTQFVCAAFLGKRVGWRGQQRESGHGLFLRQCISTHLPHTSFVAAWAALLAWASPALLLWLTPVFLGPLIAIPFSYITSSQSLGRKARRFGWFLTAEEARPPAEVQQVQEGSVTPAVPFFRTEEYFRDFGLLRAVLDPYVNGVHVSMLRHRVQASPRTRQYITFLGERLLLDGPVGLTAREKRTLLWDAECMVRAHRKLWSSPASQLHDWWQAALRHYNESSALAARRTVSAR
jgi:membrane glycosyltransferase